jgi:hypothetical protein
MKVAVLILIVFSIQLINAQARLLKESCFFDRTFYNEAIPLYESIIRENSSVPVSITCFIVIISRVIAKMHSYKLLINNYSKDLEEGYIILNIPNLKATGNYKAANSP